MASFVENVNVLAGNIQEILLANSLFDETVIPVLTEVADLDLQEVTADLVKGEYYGNRKLDIDLALNIYGLEDKIKTLSVTALATFISESLGKINYTSASILFSDGHAIELPFLGASGNPTPATSVPLVKECLERKVIQAAQKQKDRITISLTDVLNNTTYRVEIDNVDYAYTTSANATRQELALGLTGVINNNDTNRITAVFNSMYPDYIEIVANTAGIPFTLTVDDNLSVQNVQPNLDDDYIDNEFIARLVHDKDTEATLASAVYGATSVPVLRYFDLIGASSGLERITLNVDQATSSGYINPNPAFYWGKTTSALRTLAMRAGDVIKLGNEIDNLILLSASIEEVLEIQARIPELIDTYTTAADGSVTANGDLTIYNRLAELTAIHDSLVKLATIYEDIKIGGTNYINDVGADLQSADSKITVVATDLQDVDSKIATLSNNIAKINSLYANIIDNSVSKIVGVIDSGAVGKLVTNIDNSNIAKVVGKIDDASVTKIVTQIDNNNIQAIAGKITDSTLPVIYTNLPNLTEIYNNLPEIKQADDRATEAAISAANANAYSLTAQAYANSMHTLTASALTLTAGSAASVIYDNIANKIVLGVPQGPKGDRGDAFNVSATGTTAERALYDTQVKGFSFLDTELGNLYIKNSATAGDWSTAIPFGKGEKGDTGSGISNIVFTSTTDPSGLPHKLNAVDTYTILYSNGSSTSYQVANGYGQTYRILTSDYEANENEYLLCDSRATRQRNVISNIGIVQGGVYEILVDGQSALYTADTSVNQSTNLQNIVVADNYTYNVAINGEEAVYVSDPSVKQVSTLSITNIVDNTVYTVSIDGVVASYTSDPAVKQKNRINNITVVNNALYKLNINGTEVQYVSDEATAQQTTISGIVAADSTLYSLVIEGTEVSYVSGVGATVAEIRDGLITAINSNVTVNPIVTAVDNAFDIVLTADVAGVPFTTSVSSGTMDVNITAVAGYATLAEITNGLVNAINNAVAISDEVTAVVVGVGEFTVESDIAGLAFVLSVVSGTMTNTVVTPNNNATMAEVLVGLKNAINASAAPVLATVVSNTIVIEANAGGVPFTVVPDSNSTVVTSVPSNKATLAEITAGLTAAINALGQPVTAVNKTTYVTLTSDTHEDTFVVNVINGVMDVVTQAANDATLSEIVVGIRAAIDALNNPKIITSLSGSDIVVEAVTLGVGYTIVLSQGTVTLTTEQANQTGVRNITLPNSPVNGTVVTIADIKGTFDILPVTVRRNGALIMGLAEDVIIDVAQVNVPMIYVNNDWRFE